MGSTVFTGGVIPINARIALSNLASGYTVTAWRQGVPYPCTYDSSWGYTAIVPLYGTYTFRVEGQTGWKDLFVNTGGNHSIAW